MIVRVLHNGQYKLTDQVFQDLEAADAQLESAIENSNEELFKESLQKMHEIVKTKGSVVPEDEHLPSDAVIPPEDVSMEELKVILEASSGN